MCNVKRITALLFAAGVVIIFGCGDPIPVKEMVDARHAITRADGVKASQYAPDLFNEATTLLLRSHEDVKGEKWDNAKKDAESALAKAIDAYNASIPLLAKDALDKADKSVSEAGDVYASELANADYANATAKIKSAHDQFEAKKYEDAYLLAVEADTAAQNAKGLSINKKGTLKDAIEEVTETVSRAEKLGAETYAPEKFKLAKENLSIAQKAYEDLKLKDGFSAVLVAKINADEAFLEALKKNASENIAKAESMIADAEKNPNAKDASNEVDGAKEMVKTAKSQYESGQYPESIQSSDEAKRLASIALSIIEKSGEQSKVASAGKNQGKESDKAVKGTEVSTDEGNGEYDIYVVRYFKSSIKDCLWLIAGKYYKNPRQWKKIYNANRDRIKNPDLIRPGWKLKVPRMNPVKKTQEPAAPVKEEKSEVAEPQTQEAQKVEEPTVQDKQESVEPKDEQEETPAVKEEEAPASQDENPVQQEESPSAE